MASVTCPKCHRNGTYSQKFGQCFACGEGMEAKPVTKTLLKRDKPVTRRDTSVTKRDDTVTFSDEGVTRADAQAIRRNGSVTCPDCGTVFAVKARSGAERMRAWRAKRKEAGDGQAHS